MREATYTNASADIHLASVSTRAARCLRAGLMRTFVLLIAAVLVAPQAEAQGRRKRGAPAASQETPNAADDEESGAEGKDAGVCRATLVVDAQSGDVIHEQNAHEPLPPASMVKLMTAYTVLKRIKEGTIKGTDAVTVSANASRIGGSQVYLKQGEQFSVNELLNALLVQSANDAATALAEHIGGATSGFVELMKADAKALGMNESEFHTPHGLPPARDQKPDLVSANDFAILGRALMKEFPLVLEITSKQQEPFRDGAFTMSNHNKLLRTFPGCDGLKTGYYGKAGFSVTATAQRNGLRMLAVVMGCEGRKMRDEETARLMSMGFAQYASVKLIDKGAAVGAAVPVVDGVQPQVMPVAAEEVKGLVRRGEEAKVVKKYQLCPSVTAPVQPNTPCGTISFLIGDREIARVQAMIPQHVEPIGYVGRMRRFLNL